MAVQCNLAATLGGWSARHRITAITGWVVLVVVGMLIGSAAGQVTMKQSEYGTGESGRLPAHHRRAGRRPAYRNPERREDTAVQHPDRAEL